MKVWKGKELEGVNKGVMTLFVKDSQIDGNQISEFLVAHPECKRVYLGAGRLDIIEQERFDILDAYCCAKNINIIVECSLNGFKLLPESIHTNAHEIIVRFMDEHLELLDSCDVIKIDTGTNVYTVEMLNMIHTDLKTLQGDTFESDLVLYDTEATK